jgi:hypothetical protein
MDPIAEKWRRFEIETCCRLLRQIHEERSMSKLMYALLGAGALVAVASLGSRLVVADTLSGSGSSSSSSWSSSGSSSSGGAPSACTVSTHGLVSNFNGTAIQAGDTLWFNSVLNVHGLGSRPVTISFTNQVITFTSGGTTYSLPVPDATVTFDPTATAATTTFNTPNNSWMTITFPGTAGNTFLAGLAYPVPVALPGGVKPVQWGGQFSSDTSGVTISWQWATAVYGAFGADYSSLGVKPTDDNKASVYKNSDHAGTPEAFKSYVVGGATGGGGSNYTGSYSGTLSHLCQ